MRSELGERKNVAWAMAYNKCTRAENIGDGVLDAFFQITLPSRMSL